MFRRKIKPLALIDIDGVIANDKHRVPFALERNWSLYFDPALMAMDGVWEEGVALVQQLVDDGWQIGYLTGRREDRREVTSVWLADVFFPRITGNARGPLIMRPWGESTPLANLKAKRITELLDGRVDGSAVVLWDDDPEVIETVNRTSGDGTAIHCDWHIKEKALIRKAAA